MSWRAVASAIVSETAGVTALTAVPPKLNPGSTRRTLEPSAWIDACTAFEEPLPTAIRTITEATPIVIPRIVRPDRSLLAMMPVNASRSVSAPIADLRILTLVGRDFAVCEPHHPLRACGDLRLVRDDHHGPPLAIQSLEDREHLAARS